MLVGVLQQVDLRHDLRERKVKPVAAPGDSRVRDHRRGVLLTDTPRCTRRPSSRHRHCPGQRLFTTDDRHPRSPTANEVDRLSDGATLILTTALEADRTGHVYPDAPIQPEVRVGTNYNATWNQTDPTIRAAIRWLRLR